MSRDSGSQLSSGSEKTLSPAQTAENEEELINLYTCDFSEFAAHMGNQYGKEAFAKGFDIISKNKSLIYTEEGEEELVSKLKHLFGSEDTIRGFLNFCTSYIIVQNYSQNI